MSRLTAQPLLARETLASRTINRGKLYLVLFALLLPTVGATLLFTYYPQYAAIKYSFFKWDGQETEEFRGLANFRRAFFEDPLFWDSFQLTFVLLLANLVKMWPSILTAVVLHRIRSERWQYIYRVLFVIPMIIPGVVGLLIWKSFYDPSTGVVNKVLSATGMMNVLQWADAALPPMSQALMPVRAATVDLVFGNVWGLTIVGLALLTLPALRKTTGRLMGVTGMFVVAGWLNWGVLLGRYDHFVLWSLIMAVVPLALKRTNVFGPWPRVVKLSAVGLLSLAVLAVLTTMIWTKTSGAFDTGRPVWLGQTQLIVPAIVFWGFPWVGTVGVLIYLAGLQAIPGDVYEAADLDGLSSWGKFTHIELPLMLTQVRINLVFMTIGTLTDYGLILLLLGPGGGTGNAGMVPGLYAYRKAFLDNEYGYACALGMVMFVIIMIITLIYQKFVKIDK